MADMNCPYCGADQEANHDDGAGYAEDVLHEHWCHACDKRFVFETFISLSYTAHKADCLNEAPHTWLVTKTWPREYRRMRCTGCGEEREPTPEERAALDIPERAQAQQKGPAS